MKKLHKTVKDYERLATHTVPDPEFPLSQRSDHRSSRYPTRILEDCLSPARRMVFQATARSHEKVTSRMLSRNARRDFAVEVKAAGRRNSTHIPMREPKPARHPQKPSLAQSLETLSEEQPKIRPATTGRVLPSLIVEEPAQEVIETPSDLQPRRPRGRPRKVVETQSEPQPRRPRGRPRKVPVATTIVPPAPAPQAVVQLPAPAPVKAAPVATASKSAADRKSRAALPVGQRWKHRLSRWSR